MFEKTALLDSKNLSEKQGEIRIKLKGDKGLSMEY